MVCSDSLDLALVKLRAKTMHYANLLLALIFSQICNICYLSKCNILIFIKEKICRENDILSSLQRNKIQLPHQNSIDKLYWQKHSKKQAHYFVFISKSRGCQSSNIVLSKYCVVDMIKKHTQIKNIVLLTILRNNNCKIFSY